MGQYFYIVNKTKKQYLHPHKFGEGLKALEFVNDGTTLRALALLLIKSDGSGGGDIRSEDPIIGSWVGDDIAIIGDYDSSKLYHTAGEEYEELSAKLIPILQSNDLVGEIEAW